MPLLSHFIMNYMDMSHFAAPPTLGVNVVSTCNEERAVSVTSPATRASETRLDTKCLHGDATR